MTFSEMLDELRVSSSHLTYHLENLGELLSKAENGHYKLSTFGEAAVTTMKIVEEAPDVPSKHHWSLPLRWKTVLVLFLATTVLMSGLFCVEYVSMNQLTKDYAVLKVDYDRLLSWSAGTDEAIRFLQVVPQINVSAYQSTFSSAVAPRPDLANIIEETLKYSLKSSESQIDVSIRFRDNKFSRYTLSLFEGGPIYSQPQLSSVLETAKNLLQRFRTYEDFSYLEDMSSMLASIKTLENTEVTSGNIKLRITVSGTKTEITWVYVENGIEFQSKYFSLVFDKRDLTELTDNWFLFTIGSTTINISSEEAIAKAKEYLKTYKWTADGVEVSNFKVLDEPVSCLLLPHVRGNSLALIPYWYVTFTLDKTYPGGVDLISVGIWADTAEVAHVRTLSGP